MKTAFKKKLICMGLCLANLISVPALASTAPSWSGPYIGGHFGHTWSDFNNVSGVAGPEGSDASFSGGAQIGDSWQMDNSPFVVGIEGDWSALDLESRNNTATFQEDWMSTVRGRMGYAMGQLMPYITAGLGMTDTVSKAPGFGAETRLRLGPAAGAGMDFMLSELNDDSRSGPSNRWFGRVEYLYVNAPADGTSVGSRTVAGGSDNQTLRVALNYKL